MHYLFYTFTITLVFCALSVFYFNYYVGVLRTFYFLLLLLRRRVGTICFPLLRLGWCFAHYLFSTFTSTLVYCALFVFYFYYDVGVLRTICFLLLLLRWCIAHYLFSTFTITLVFYALFVIYSNCYVGVLRTICILLALIRWCFAHYIFVL